MLAVRFPLLRMEILATLCRTTFLHLPSFLWSLRFLGGVRIPDEVRQRQLNVATQTENNIEEENLQKGLLIRQETTRRVNEVDNKAELVTEQAKADAKLTVSTETHVLYKQFHH